MNVPSKHSSTDTVEVEEWASRTASESQMMNYYKGLINDSYESLAHRGYNLITNNKDTSNESLSNMPLELTFNKKESDEKPKTPVLNSFTVNRESKRPSRDSLLEFIDSPVRHRNKEYVLSYIDPFDTAASVVEFHDNSSINDVPSMKDVSMTESDIDFVETKEPVSPPRETRKEIKEIKEYHKPSFSQIRRTLSTKKSETSVKPRLKNAKSLPQLKGIGTITRKPENKLKKSNNNNSLTKMFTQGSQPANPRGQAVNLSSHQSNFRPSFSHSRFSLSQSSEPLEDKILVVQETTNHRKSNSHSVLENSKVIPEKPKLITTSSSTTNVIGKLKLGIKKLSSPVSPRMQMFGHQSIDSVSSPISPSFPESENSLTFRARSLVKKASMSNINRTKSLKNVGLRAKSNTITSTTTDDSNNSNGVTYTNSSSEELGGSSMGKAGGYKSTEVTDTDEDSFYSEKSPNIVPSLLTSPVIKVSALASQFNELNISQTEIDNAHSINIDELLHTNPRTPKTPQDKLFSDSDSKLVESLIRQLADTLERMNTEDAAFETTESRLVESGWYSESNIDNIKKQRQANKQKWQRRVNSIKAKLMKINESNKKIDYNIKTPKRAIHPDQLETVSKILHLASPSQGSEANIDAFETFTFEKM